MQVDEPPVPEGPFTFGKVLARKRKALPGRPSQTALAEMANLSRGSVERAELDNPHVTHETITKIVRALNTTIEQVAAERDQLNLALAEETQGVAGSIQHLVDTQKTRAKVTVGTTPDRERNPGESETDRLVPLSEVEMREIERHLCKMTPQQAALWRAHALVLCGAILSGGDPDRVEGPQSGNTTGGSS